MLTQPGDLHIDSPLRAAASLQLLRIPSHVVEREAQRRGFASPLALRDRATADPNVLAAFAQFHCAIQTRKSADEIRTLLSRCIGTLVDACCDDEDPNRAPTEHVSLRRARAHMSESLAGVCSLEELADVSRVGKFQLIKLFRQHWGLPPKKYLMHMRVARARTLLSQGMACTGVAQETGFYDQSHLNRWFRCVYGLSPGVYVRQRRAALPGDADGNNHSPVTA